MGGEFLQDLAVVLLVAGVVTLIFHRLKQPVVLGYILAGVIVGPHTPAIPLSISDEHTVEIMSEMGVILLMFGLGLHFSFRKLAQVGPTAVIGATLEIVVMTAAGYGLGRLFGWNWMDSVFLGAILAISSTTIIIKALAELRLSHERFAHLIFGILIVEDILAIAMIALLSGLATSGTLAAGDVAMTLGQLSIFLTGVVVFGLLLVPMLLRYVARFRSDEMLLVVSLGLCFGVSLIALRLGYSVALGAFLIGALVAEAREHGKVETLITPVRDMFSAVFFVAIGMLIEPKMLLTYAVPILLITATVVVGKVLSCGLGTFLAGNDARTSMRVGMGLSQIGEFSFIIAALGLSLKVTSDFLYPIAVAVSAITTLLTPYLIRSSDATVRVFSRLVPERAAALADLYTAWIRRLGAPSADHNQVRRLLRKWVVQIVLNMALMAGIFLTAAAFSRSARESWPPLPDWTGGPEGVSWLGAMVISLPLLIVSWRKLRAVGLVAAEATITRGTREQTQVARSIVTGVIRGVGSVAMLALLAALSATMMPPLPVLLVAAGIAILLAALRWRSFERLYARAQDSLRSTLSSDSATAPVDAERALPVLAGAQLQGVQIAPHSPAAGRLIRELELRSRTGASAVAIERDGESVINPGADEELRSGDRVLLLGTPQQLERALSIFK